MGHEMRSISLHLLIGRDGTKNNFCELSAFKGSICDTSTVMLEGRGWIHKMAGYIPYDFEWVFYNSNRKMRSVVDKPCNVVLRHLWQLFLKDAFKACEDDKALLGAIVIHNSKFDLPSTLL
jgi:hypothetical protein